MIFFLIAIALVVPFGGAVALRKFRAAAHCCYPSREVSVDGRDVAAKRLSAAVRYESNSLSGCARRQLCVQRQHHREGGARPRAGALGSHRSAVQFDDVPHQREAEPETAHSAIAERFALFEALEYVRQ
jgi:hypothetical protein